MDEVLYQALTKYYHTLELLGYMSKEQSDRLLVLIFYNEFIYKDFNGILDREDYYAIDKALDCLYGTSCLIPYPTYLNMGKLYINEFSEITSRLEALENTNVVKVSEAIEEETDSDIIIISEEDDSD